MKILFVENDPRMFEPMRIILEDSGYTVEAIHSGEMGEEYAEVGTYDLLLVDVAIPNFNSFQLVKTVRKKRFGVPILMITGQTGSNDRIECLNAGADYCITKPFDSREVLAIIKMLLRRQGAQAEKLQFGNTTLELDTGKLVHGDKFVRLTSREFDVMRILMQYGEKNVSKEKILSRVWGYDADVDDNSVEVYIAFLRKKLLRIESDIRISVARRIGYYLEHK